MSPNISISKLIYFLLIQNDEKLIDFINIYEIISSNLTLLNICRYWIIFKKYRHIT